MFPKTHQHSPGATGGSELKLEEPARKPCRGPFTGWHRWVGSLGKGMRSSNGGGTGGAMVGKGFGGVGHYETALNRGAVAPRLKTPST